MATQTYRAADFKGLTPAVDATRSNELYALNGKNYIFDAIGPKSAFGDRLLLPHKFDTGKHIQGVRLKLRTGDRCFTITTRAILEWDEETGGWQIIYLTPDTGVDPYRWTFAYLNDVMFFNHPRTGIIEYDLITDVCKLSEGIGTPTEVLAICENNGRLIAMGPVLSSWSAQSNGRDFDPQLGGAGFQKINDRVAGFPLMVTSHATGYLTWTTGGVMRSEFTGDKAVYRHRALNTEYRLANPFCAVKLDNDTTVFLDERGLFETRGEAPTPFTPLFNEFLIDYIRRNKLKVGQNLRLEWDELRRLLFVSTSLSYADPLYEKCFVLYPPLDKWGQFDSPHYGIIPLRINTSERSGDFFAFVDENRQLRYWRDTGSRETEQTDPTVNLYYPPIQKPFQEVPEESGLILSSSMVANTFNDVLVTQPAGYYANDGTSLVPPILQGLDAWVWLGFMRPNFGDSNDQMSEIIQVLIRSNTSGDEVQAGVDFNLIPDGTADQDYNLGSGTTDFGVEPANYINHQTKIISSIDGTSEFSSQIPELVAFVKGARHYSCAVPGIWHMLELKATDVGEAFYLKTFELTFTYAGKLM